jgi:adenylate kinase
VGIDSSVEILSGWLADKEVHRVKVVVITGVGVIGKTTLAKVLYRKLRGQLECLAFVRSSPYTDMRRFLTDMLLQIRRHQPVDAYKVLDLIKQIKAHLKNKK